jgi:S-adenosylmethionine hydrolase
MKPSGIITLATDFGLTDPYVGMMKGVILSINPKARLVDISHHIQAGSILHGSAMIRETYPYFPEGTVHLAVVDPGVGSDRRVIGLESDGHLFVGPDNGLFWPVIESNKGGQIFHLTEERYFLPHVTNTFHGREIFSPVAAHLSLGTDLKKMGKEIKDPVELSSPAPYVSGDTLCGRVVRIDHFGNLITKTDLQRFLKNRKPVVHIGDLKIENMDKNYSDVGKGEPLALINSSDLLEVAVNLDRASELVGTDGRDMMGAVVKVTI